MKTGNLHPRNHNTSKQALTPTTHLRLDISNSCLQGDAHLVLEFLSTDVVGADFDQSDHNALLACGGRLHQVCDEQARGEQLPSERPNAKCQTPNTKVNAKSQCQKSMPKVNAKVSTQRHNVYEDNVYEDTSKIGAHHERWWVGWTWFVK